MFTELPFPRNNKRPQLFCDLSLNGYYIWESILIASVIYFAEAKAIQFPL